jgi:hypothetical protein
VAGDPCDKLRRSRRLGRVTGIVSTPAVVVDGGEQIHDACPRCHPTCHWQAFDDDATQARNTSQERQDPGVTHNWYGT